MNHSDICDDIRRLSEALFDTINYIKSIVEHLDMTELKKDEDIDSALDTTRELMNRK